MIIQVMTVFMVPMFQSIWRESVVKRNENNALEANENSLQDENK